MNIVINTLLFILVVFISMFLSVASIEFYQKMILTIITWGIGFHFYFRNLELFVPTLFFIINTVLVPISIYLMEMLSIKIPQLYFILSIIVYLSIVLNINKFKKNITWLKLGKFDIKIILLIFMMAILSGLSLFIWAVYIKKDLSEFRKFIPNISFEFIILFGFIFAILNSFFEEFLARAVLFDGFLNIFQNIAIVIIGQALVFSIWHYNGFPGGPIGVILVFIWSIFLGIIRYLAKGMMPPMIAHFFADLSIAIILFFLVVLPNRP